MAVDPSMSSDVFGAPVDPGWISGRIAPPRQVNLNFVQPAAPVRAAPMIEPEPDVAATTPRQRPMTLPNMVDEAVSPVAITEDGAAPKLQAAPPALQPTRPATARSSAPGGVRDAIVRAAREAGMSPSYALAVAERESSFNPTAKNSKTIRGLFQMTGDLRGRYGVGDSDDPYEQTKAFAAHYRALQGEMKGILKRSPTDEEAYLGHHFGGRRAARMMNGDPDTPVSEIFTKRELDRNPHIRKAGTSGALISSVTADLERRRAGFPDENDAGIFNPAEYGIALQDAL